MIVEYDEEVFRQIPNEWVKELEQLVQSPSRTTLWQYSIDRGFYPDQSFENFKRNLNRANGIEVAFTIPPIKSAPKSNRIFAPGFSMPKGRDIREYLLNNGDLAIGPISEVRRLHSIWHVFYESHENNFLDDATITLPRLIVHGKTMKWHDGIANAHYSIGDLMKKLGEKYSIPVYSLEKEASTA